MLHRYGFKEKTDWTSLGSAVNLDFLVDYSANLDGFEAVADGGFLAHKASKSQLACGVNWKIAEL